MGVNLFTKLEKGSRTRKQFEALVPGKLDAAVLTPYDFITSIAAGYNIPESSLIAASNLLPQKFKKFYHQLYLDTKCKKKQRISLNLYLI